MLFHLMFLSDFMDSVYFVIFPIQFLHYFDLNLHHDFNFWFHVKYTYRRSRDQNFFNVL